MALAGEDDIEGLQGLSRPWSSDIHKMHTYRDALNDVRSVRVLYPGARADWHGVGSSSAPEGWVPFRFVSGARTTRIACVPC